MSTVSPLFAFLFWITHTFSLVFFRYFCNCFRLALITWFLLLSDMVFLWTFTIYIITVKEREPYNIPHYYYPLSWSSLKRLSQTPMMTLFFCKKSQRPLAVNNFLQKASFIDFWQGLIYTSDWENFISIRIQRWDSNWLLVASALSIFTSIPISCNYWQSVYYSWNLVLSST